MNFTAAQIAAALGLTPQAVRLGLRGTAPAGFLRVGGRATAAWQFCQLPGQWQSQLESRAETQNQRNPEALLASPAKRWVPPLPLDEICEEDRAEAATNRDIFRPFLTDQHNWAIADEMDTAGVNAYHQRVGFPISKSYFRKLFNRYVERAGVSPDWNDLSIYLPVRPRPNKPVQETVAPELAGEFKALETRIAEIKTPLSPDPEECQALWGLALRRYSDAVAKGDDPKDVQRRLLTFLLARAKFLAPSEDALRKLLERRLARGIEDGRRRNGNRAKYPIEDIKRLRASAIFKNGKRIDAAWREEYKHLSEYTRGRHPFRWKCPRALAKAVNRQRVEVLHAAANSQAELRNQVGRLCLDHSQDRSMDEWSVDDVTSNVQVSLQDQAGLSLLLPQIVVTMDNASRKIVGWAMSSDQGPTSRLVCTSIKKAMRDYGVPSVIGLENGFVFGKSLNIHGKEDEAGNKIVLGLERYGCEVRHYKPHNPTSKPDLENSFNTIQRLMERMPGYGGRLQMLDASDLYRSQEKDVKSGKAAPAAHRFDFDEFAKAFGKIVEKYNATEQPYGRLKCSPNEAFEKLKGPNPPTKFPPQLLALLDETYRVPVRAGGVKFTHHGRRIDVKGGCLADYIGQELWAVVASEDNSLVTFMSLDYSEVFTIEAMPNPRPNEIRIATGSDKLATGLQRINGELRRYKNEASELLEKFGDPRKDALDNVRETFDDTAPADSDRKIVMDPARADALAAAITQRQDVQEQRKQDIRANRRASDISDRTGLSVKPAGLGRLKPHQLEVLKNLKINPQTL